MTRPRAVLTLAEWGAYWLRCASTHPDHAGASHHNAAMCALHIMALEASA